MRPAGASLLDVGLVLMPVQPGSVRSPVLRCMFFLKKNTPGPKAPLSMLCSSLPLMLPRIQHERKRQAPCARCNGPCHWHTGVKFGRKGVYVARLYQWHSRPCNSEIHVSEAQVYAHYFSSDRSLLLDFSEVFKPEFGP